MKEFQFKYGAEKVNFSLDEKNIIAELSGVDTPPIKDIPQAVFDCLSNPVAHQPLDEWIKSGEKVAVVVSDMSRFWMRQDLVIPHVITYLNDRCGVPDGDITIIIANGTHIGGSDDEVKQIVTENIYNRINICNHDCNSKNLKYVGTTSRGTVLSIDPFVASRKTICIGACTQHVMAGFGGGRKSILPGVASMEAIKQNHAHSLDPLAPQSNPLIGNGVLNDNPLNEDMCEAAQMVGHLFMVNLVMNADMKLAYLFGGHWLKSWEKGCEMAEKIYEVPIKEQADVVFVSSGGAPKDMSLYQGSKTIDNVESALKIGGTLVAMMECPEGGGPAEYFDWLVPLKEGKLDEALRADFTIPGYIFYLNCEQARRYNIVLQSKINPKEVAPMGITAFDDIDKLMNSLDLQGKSVYVVANGSTVIPKVKG